MYDIEKISEINPEALLADGFEEAILGMCLQFAQEPDSINFKVLALVPHLS